MGYVSAGGESAARFQGGNRYDDTGFWMIANGRER